MKKLSKNLVEAIGMYHAMNKWLSENLRAENWFEVFRALTDETVYINDLCKKEGVYRMPREEFDKFELVNEDAKEYASYCHEYGYAA